jgi:outer membrane murein-binding lipoprotein Lpp
MISSKTHRLAAVVLGALLIAGCGVLKKKQPDEAASAAPTPAAPPAVVAPAAPAVAVPEPTVAVADESVPAPEDFEDEAFEKVSDKTYKAELAGLKKELEAK